MATAGISLNNLFKVQSRLVSLSGLVVVCMRITSQNQTLDGHDMVIFMRLLLGIRPLLMGDHPEIHTLWLPYEYFSPQTSSGVSMQFFRLLSMASDNKYLGTILTYYL